MALPNEAYTPQLDNRPLLQELQRRLMEGESVDSILTSLGVTKLFGPYTGASYGNRPVPGIINNQAYDLPQGMNNQQFLEMISQLFGNMKMKGPEGLSLPAPPQGGESLGQLYSGAAQQQGLQRALSVTEQQGAVPQGDPARNAVLQYLLSRMASARDPGEQQRIRDILMASGGI